jgi:hypothetical protein
MSDAIPQNCSWVGGVSPADVPDTVEAVNARIRWHLDQVGELRRRRTNLRRAERASAMPDIRRDFEAGMSRPAVCRKHRITLGQLTSFASRGGWKCGLRKRGNKAAVTADQLPELRAAYESDPSMLKVIAGRFGITGKTLTRYATHGGWVRLARAALTPMPPVEMGNQVWP